MPIGCPSQSPEPKSACTGSSSPIERIIAAELGATGSLSTRWFHGFVAGKIGQPAIVGAFGAAPAAKLLDASKASTSNLERIQHRGPSRSGLQQRSEERRVGKECMCRW